MKVFQNFIQIFLLIERTLGNARLKKSLSSNSTLAARRNVLSTPGMELGMPPTSAVLAGGRPNSTPGVEYIFLLPRKVCPWEGTEMKVDFSFPRESFTFRDRREEGQVV